MLGNDLSVIDGATVACIGPVTARAARQAGLHVGIEAEEHTIKGLVRALVGHFTARRGG
jgi:uroporphyrinogen III methyltransferase/synthase